MIAYVLYIEEEFAKVLWKNRLLFTCTCDPKKLRRCARKRKNKTQRIDGNVGWEESVNMFRGQCIECIIKEKSSSGIKKKYRTPWVIHMWDIRKEKQIEREKCACSFIRVYNLNTSIQYFFLYLSISVIVLPRLHLSVIAVYIRWEKHLD